MTDLAPTLKDCKPLAEMAGSAFCFLEGSGQHWAVCIRFDVRKHCFAVGKTPFEAVKKAQDRAANLVRGLQDMENQLKGSMTI
jgi:hypothetical protein